MNPEITSERIRFSWFDWSCATDGGSKPQILRTGRKFTFNAIPRLNSRTLRSKALVYRAIISEVWCTGRCRKPNKVVICGPFYQTRSSNFYNWTLNLFTTRKYCLFFEWYLSFEQFGPLTIVPELFCTTNLE